MTFVSFGTAGIDVEKYSALPMEIFLHLWDECDDYFAASRHVISALAAEVADVAGVMATIMLTWCSACWSFLSK
jgi:hypothetical protein